MTKQERGRFIAGAICPACRELDKLLLRTRADGQSERACVSCGFEEIMDASGSATGQVPRGKHERTTQRAEAENMQTQPVRLIDPKAPGSSS